MQSCLYAVLAVPDAVYVHYRMSPCRPICSPAGCENIFRCMCIPGSFRFQAQSSHLKDFPAQLLLSMAIQAEVVQQCTTLLAGAQDGDRLVKTVHEVLTILERHGHVYTLQLKPSMVGISPLNRDGSGVNPVDVHELLSDIATAGWLDSRVTAVAVEPCSPEDFQWNLEYFQTTGGMLGTVDTSQLKATEAACRWSSWGSEIRPFTVHQIPQLLSLVQRMGNATLQRAEHELQLMRRLHQLWMAHSHGDIQPDFGVIKQGHHRQDPLLNETEAFVRLHSPSTRSLGHEFWERVVADAKGTNHVTVLWKHVIQHMFMDHDVRHGLVLQTSTTPFPIFADLAILIAGEAALK
eukprot:s1496_g1.t1